VKTLERNRIDGIVREVETGAYRLALALVSDAGSAERIVLEAFASLAPSLARLSRPIELREKLYARIRQRAARQRRAPAITDDRPEPVAIVSDGLHLRIVDLLEEEQSVEPAGRRRGVLVAVVGVVLVGALIAFVRVHADALAAAQPTITELSPAAAANDVSVSGDVRVKFGRRPVANPTLRLEPAHAVLESAHWDGNTWVAVYSGLHLATRYQLVLQADYRSRLQDVGHFERRWTMTTQGYPVLSALTPSRNQLLVARVGQISVDFSYRPPVDPRVSVSPPDGTVLPGRWSGMTWMTGYSGLLPLTRYQATLIVDYGVAAASTQRQWTFSTEPSAPPSGVPVIWYGTSSQSTPQSQLVRWLAIDWHGDVVGSMYLTSRYLVQVPDGSVLSTQDGAYVDRNGARFTAAFGSLYVGIIADDSQSVCRLSDIGGSQWWLFSGPLRGPLHRVGPAGLAGAQSGLGIIACSVASDRAVLADNGRGGTTVARVIALSTGRVLYERSYDGLTVSVISSHDGRFLAEQIPSYDAQGQPAGAVTLIRRTLDGRVVARIDKQRVLQFSWDGLRVVTGPTFMAMGTNQVAILEWQTGKILWRLPSDPATDTFPRVFAIPQPNGPVIAIAAGTQPRNGDADQLWLVSADGEATQVVRDVFYPGFIGL
jgi:hypothetical protein